jgi:hypothetical protein
MRRALLLVGLILFAAGLLWPWLARLRLGRLPGDLVFQLGRVTVYVPLASMLLVSLLLSVLSWWWRR